MDSSWWYLFFTVTVATAILYMLKRSKERKDEHPPVPPPPPPQTVLKQKQKPEITTPPVTKRPWMELAKADPNKEHIRIMQYNILAECYASVERYTYVSKESLAWSHRKWVLLGEMLHYSPDIICLQEVDHFNFFDEQLKQYKGFYVKRGGLHRDGCALFVNKDRFKVKAYTTVDYNSLQVENATGWANMLRYKKDNVGILMLLEIVSTSQLFCVATTHLYWDPKLSDLKVKQGHMLLEEIAKFLNKKSPKKLLTPVIITGDFNSMPDSAVYELYVNGSVAGNHTDLKEYGVKGKLKHELPTLQSVYSNINEPLTNITPWFKGTLDYIFYTEKHFKVLGLIPELNTTKLPTNKWPSDHVSLVADLQLE